MSNAAFQGAHEVVLYLYHCSRTRTELRVRVVPAVTTQLLCDEKQTHERRQHRHGESMKDPQARNQFGYEATPQSTTQLNRKCLDV